MHHINRASVWRYWKSNLRDSTMMMVKVDPSAGNVLNTWPKPKESHLKSNNGQYRIQVCWCVLNHMKKLKIVRKYEINNTVVFLTVLLRDCPCLLSSRSTRLQRKDQRWRFCAWRPRRGAHVCPSPSFARWEFRPSAADVRNALFSSLLLGLSINSSLFITIPMTTRSYYRAKVKDCSHYLFIYCIVFSTVSFFFLPVLSPVHPSMLFK